MKTVLFFHTSHRQAWRKEIDGVYRFAKTRGWRVQVIEPTKRPPRIEALIRFWNPIGCLVECSGAPSAYFDVEAFGHTPTVFLGRDPRSLPPSASFVNPSDKGPGVTAAKEFLKAGLTSFGFIALRKNDFWSRDREADFKKALWLNGYRCRTFGRKETFRTEESKRNALSKWLTAIPKPCGILAENDYSATEVLDIANNLRIKVPDRLSVIGIDNDSELCENTKPKLSSIPMDFEHSGFRICEILSHLIEHPESGPIHETYSSLGLLRRGSTPSGIGAKSKMDRVLAFIRENACSGITAADVANQLPGSRRLAEMNFRKVVGRTILEEILNVRFEQVEALLRDKSQQLGAIAGLCGWKTENALRTAFLKRYGKSMRDWRQESSSTSYPSTVSKPS